MSATFYTNRNALLASVISKFILMQPPSLAWNWTSFFVPSCLKGSPTTLDKFNFFAAVHVCSLQLQFILINAKEPSGESTIGGSSCGIVAMTSAGLVFSFCGGRYKRRPRDHQSIQLVDVGIQHIFKKKKLASIVLFT